MAYKKRCNNCIHILCDVVGRQRPERNLEFVCESIALFERCYGYEYKEETRELALDAISKYGPGTPFENDERMLAIYRILASFNSISGKYSRSMSSTDLYDKLHEKGLFTGSAAFYVDWAEVHLQANLTDRAKEILAKMEQAVGAQHVSCVRLRQQLFGDEAGQPDRQRTSAGMSKIATLVKPTEGPSQAARRNLFGSSTTGSSMPSVIGSSRISAEPIVEEQTIKSQTGQANHMLPPPRDESIVLPNIVDAPPIDMSIVSPSINLIQSGQIPSNFSLPPVFSFSNSVQTSTSSYKPAMQPTTRETAMITNSIMSSSMMSSMQSSHMLTGLPSHPAQIGQGHFAVPSIPPFRADFGQSTNTENMDPRGAHASGYSGRRDIAGVLQPSKNFDLDPFEELETEKTHKSTFEIKASSIKYSHLSNRTDLIPFSTWKARLQNQRPQPSAVRRIFPDTATQLSNDFQSFGFNAPSTSKHS